jgi:hypothetical protein
VVANVRYPGEESRLWFLPCIDTVVLLGAFTLLARRGRKVPWPALVAVSAFFLFVRFFRIADGISGRAFGRKFDLYVNLTLLPELPRLLGTTLSVWQLGLLGFGVLAGMTLVGVVCYAALRVAAESLHAPDNQRLFLAASLGFVCFSLIPRDLRDGLMRPPPASASGRLVAELRSIIHASGTYERERRAVASARAELGRMPNDLARLGHADVLLFIVESYGETVLEDAAYVPTVRREFTTFERELGAAGYVLASNVLESPTFGGCSWFAHAALDTGIRVEDQHAFEALRTDHPFTLADELRAAGYRTVLAEPGTQRAAINYLHFDREYYASAFGYRGPQLGWGKLPDQLAIDFIHRRELVDRQVPRFIQYALVTSHAPWLAEATVLDDWSRVGDGSVFAALPIKRHATDWSSLDQASSAYLDAIVYDLEVLRRYLASELHNDTLVIIVGDHQPPGGVTRSSTGHGVPIHVLSRKSALVAPFLARGYASGMWPRESSKRPGMESFLFDFVRDFSSDLRQTSWGRSPLGH